MARKPKAAAAEAGAEGSTVASSAPQSFSLEFKVGTPAKAYHFHVHNMTSEAAAKAALAKDLSEIVKQCA